MKICNEIRGGVKRSIQRQHRDVLEQYQVDIPSSDEEVTVYVSMICHLNNPEKPPYAMFGLSLPGLSEEKGFV
ncbi:hypothetical protein J6590_021649 [Homalodisca vitripennis]|nr:hypothetical protein J6590_021649 [Homalodisca vitripennis]